MATNALHCVICCLTVLLFCVDQGDGRWKKKSRKKLQHDIDVFRKMADNLEHEIELFYEGNLEEETGDDIEENSQQYESALKKTENDIPDIKESSHNISNIILESTSRELKAVSSVSRDKSPVLFVNNIENTTRNETYPDMLWPKFGDILLAMGKQYDWKNDRWVKVKRKVLFLNKITKNKLVGSMTHQKPKFSYRIVRLNRNKKRNVVIAVSAVR